MLINIEHEKKINVVFCSTVNEDTVLEDIIAVVEKNNKNVIFNKIEKFDDLLGVFPNEHIDCVLIEYYPRNDTDMCNLVSEIKNLNIKIDYTSIIFFTDIDDNYNLPNRREYEVILKTECTPYLLKKSIFYSIEKARMLLETNTYVTVIRGMLSVRTDINDILDSERPDILVNRLREFKTSIVEDKQKSLIERNQLKEINGKFR